MLASETLMYFKGVGLESGQRQLFSPASATDAIGDSIGFEH